MLRRREIASRQNPVPFVIGGWPQVVKPKAGIRAEMHNQSMQSSSSTGLGLPDNVVSDIYNRGVRSLLQEQRILFKQLRLQLCSA